MSQDEKERTACRTGGTECMADLARPALRLWLSLAALLAFCLRFPGLSSFQITHWDEGLAWRGAQWFASAGATGHYSPTHAPPLASLLFGATSALCRGGPEAAVWISAAAGCLTVLAAAWLGSELAGRRCAVLAACLLALSPVHVMYSRTLLTESLYSLLLLTTCAAALRALRRDGVRDYWLAGLFAAALQATKYNGFVALVMPALLLGWKQRGSQAGKRALARRATALLLPATSVVGLNLGLLAATGKLSAFFEHYGRYVGARAEPAALFETFGWLCVHPVTGALGLVGLLGVLRWRGPAGFLLAGSSLIYLCFALRYTLYLRLLLPLAGLTLVAAAVAVSNLAVRSRRLATFLALLLLALEGQGHWNPAVRAAVNPSFDGYQQTEHALGLASQSTLPLMATQAFVWSSAASTRGGQKAVVASPGGSKAQAYLEALGTEEVLFLYDIGAFSSQRDWHLGALHLRLREHPSYRRFENSLNLDCLQNNLLLEELRQLDLIPELQERLLGIHAVRMPANELMRLVGEIGLQRPR